MNVSIAGFLLIQYEQRGQLPAVTELSPASIADFDMNTCIIILLTTCHIIIIILKQLNTHWKCERENNCRALWEK